MSAKEAQQRRSQARAARKRAGNRPGPRSRVVTMTPEDLRRMASPIITELAVKHGITENVVAAVVEMMVDEGEIGLDDRGQLTSMVPNKLTGS